jgi:Dolichyl-phosphate-mannose-protein mannosyltransferase
VRTRWLDLAFVGLVVAGGAALRWIHLGTPSLWWDEVIDIAMARVGSVGDVLRVVREGVPAGSANAGAMPLDYVILHGWLAIAPAPRPESLEIFFRFPAFVWSVVALVAMAGFARCHLGREVGLVALLLLALSLPHVLYAAEVRWYSLLVLVTILHLWAFARLLDAPADARRWLLWVSCAAAAVLTAVLSIVPLAAELLVLAVVVERARGVVVSLLASAAVIGLLVAWLVLPSLGVIYGRPASARPGMLATTDLVLRFLAWDQVVLLLALVIALPLAWRDAGRHHRAPRLALVVALALGFLTIPIVTLLAHLKSYYVHPRHVIFLLPAFVVLVAIGIVGACRRVVGERRACAVAIGVVLVVQGGVVLRYVRAPEEFFARIKIPHDVRGVVEALRPPAGKAWLVLAERESVSNTVLTYYLRWYGLEQQVVLRGTRDVSEALRLLSDSRAPVAQLAMPPLATIPVGLTPELRAFLRIDPDTGPPPPSIAGGTLVVWHVPAGTPAGVVQQRFEGAALFERAPTTTSSSGAAADVAGD